MTPERGPCAAVLILAGVAAAGLAVCSLGAAPIKGLSQAPLLTRAYDLVYDADFAGADAALAQACPPAPEQACAVIGVAAQWWRIYLDLDDRSTAALFVSRVTATIERGEQWVAREPERAEAWFYLGAAYGSRVQYRGHRADYFAAARDGKRIKTALEQAVSLDPDLHDAYFGVGLYQYYADTATAALKLVRWLLLLPGGNKAEGMKQMLQAREQGTLLKAEAAYQLHLIDLWYEHQPDHALALLGELHARYPHNPLFVLNTAQVHEVYQSDHQAALAAYRALVDGAHAGTFREPALAEGWGRLGAAAQLNALAQPDRALEEAQWVIDRRPPVPYGAVALAELEAARAWERKGQREKAAAACRAAITAAPTGDPRRVRRDAESMLSRLR